MSGNKITVTVPPKIYRWILEESADCGSSMNAFIVERLEGRPVIIGLKELSKELFALRLALQEHQSSEEVERLCHYCESLEEALIRKLR